MQLRTPNLQLRYYLYFRLCDLPECASHYGDSPEKQLQPSDEQVVLLQLDLQWFSFHSIPAWKDGLCEPPHSLTWFGQVNWPSFQVPQHLIPDPALAATPLLPGCGQLTFESGTPNLWLDIHPCSIWTPFQWTIEVFVLLVWPMSRWSKFRTLSVDTWLAWIALDRTRFWKGLKKKSEHFGCMWHTPSFSYGCLIGPHLYGALARRLCSGVGQKKQMLPNDGLGRSDPKCSPGHSHQPSNAPTWFVLLCHSIGHVSWLASIFQRWIFELLHSTVVEKRSWIPGMSMAWGNFSTFQSQQGPYHEGSLLWASKWLKKAEQLLRNWQVR